MGKQVTVGSKATDVGVVARLAARVSAALRRGREVQFARQCALIERTGRAGVL